MTDLNQHYKNPLEQRQQKLSSGPWQVREAHYQGAIPNHSPSLHILVKYVYNMKNQGRKKGREMQGESTFVDDGGVGKLSQAGAKSCCAI